MTGRQTYAFKARDLSGTLVEGTMTATSATEVGSQLRAEGKCVLAVTEHALTAAAELNADEIIRSEFAKRVKRDDVIAFAQQLGVMQEAGVPLGEALDSFRRQTRSQDFQRVLSHVSDDLNNGDPLSVAMARWPRVFPGMMVSLMKASEASGTMASMLVRVGTYLAKERRTVRQIKSAMSYPLFMVTLGLAITVFLMALVLPRFAAIYEQRSARLPLPTQVLLSISDIVTQQALIYTPVLTVLTIGFLLWRRTGTGRKTLDWLRLHTPIVSRLYQQLYLTRAARTMSTLLAAGVGLLDIIDICRGVTRNYYWSLLWDELDRQVRNGHRLSEAMTGSPVIPPNVVSMVAAGENAGQLSTVMARVAEFSEDELDAAVKQATSFIEPLMICVMGVVIGGVALALLLPIFTLGNVMSGI